MKHVATMSSETYRDKDWTKRRGKRGRNRDDNRVIRFSLLQVNDSAVVGDLVSDDSDR